MIFQADNEQELADKVWERISQSSGGGVIIGLVGDLGAGKTALVKGIARKLGVKESVTSPTFNLRKSYPIKKTNGADNLQHIDLYRIEKQNSKDIGEINDWISDRSAVTFIEWIDHMSELFKKADIIIHLNAISEKVREVEITTNGNSNKISR